MLAVFPVMIVIKSVFENIPDQRWRTKSTSSMLGYKYMYLIYIMYMEPQELCEHYIYI